MSLRLRLNLLITGLLLLVMCVGAILMIRNAREDVRAELESTASLALHLLDTEILTTRQITPGSTVRTLPGLDVPGCKARRISGICASSF